MDTRRFTTAILATLALLAAACGVDPGADSTPTPTPIHEPLQGMCFSTEAYALEHIVAVIGEDVVPTRFDGINGGGCSFNGDIKAMRVTLTMGDHSQSALFEFGTPTNEVGVPWEASDDDPIVDATLEPGLYERTVTAIATDGRESILDGFEPVLLVRDLDSVQTQILRAESRWQRSGVRTYTYEMAWQCFCIQEWVAPVNVSVVDGTVARIEFADPTQSGDIPSPERFGAIETLFEFLHEAVERDAVSITAEFHEQLGYPVSAFVDYDRMIADEEMGFVVNGLTP